jgi:hypothetical protein
MGQTEENNSLQQVSRMGPLAWTPVVADSAARDALFPTPQGNEKIYRADIRKLERYDAAFGAWVLDVLEKPDSFLSLLGALEEGLESVAYQVLTDSTGNETTEWPYLTAQWLATKYPAYTVNHILWDDTAQDYQAPNVIQTGPLGARYYQFSGSGGSGGTTQTCLTIPDSEIPMFTGDLDIRIKVAATNWTPAALNTLIARFGNAGLRSFRFYLKTSGALEYQWTTDGTTLFTATFASPVGTNGVPMWLRITHKMNNGAGGNDANCYKSADGNNGANWTAIGSTVTTAGALTNLFAPGASMPWELGGRLQSVELLTGGIYEIDIRQGINGAPIGPRLVDAWYTTTSSVPPVLNGSPILTCVNGAMPGQGITYLSDATRLPKLTPKYGQAAIYLSNSHNDTNQFGPTYLGLWDTWWTALKLRFPTAQGILVTQNPRTAPALYIREHAVRRRQLIEWATRNAIDMVDVYRAFKRDGRALSVLVDPADGIHPIKPAGAALWARAIENALAQRA